jgi:MoxR-like ATPase
MSAAPSLAEVLHALRAHVGRQVFGKQEVVDLCLMSVLAGGHVLIEDVPGVGKTTLGLALAQALGGTFRRVQCTADLLPSDIVGATVLEPRTGTFAFREGPLFANVVLADEINRTPPRTQSALLEAMNERQVSVDGQTHPLPSPFLVIATQNPHEFQGTFPLPDAQLDRFLIRTTMGYPDREAERAILRGDARRTEDGAPALSETSRAQLLAATAAVTLHAEVEDYVLDLVAATRSTPLLARGVSPRGAEALVRACRARAVLQGRGWAVAEDVRALAVPVLAHRIVARAETGPGAAEAALRALLDRLPPPL